MQENFLNFINNKTLFYDKIDYTIINKAWDILKKHVKLPYVIHIVGTNGKGTTGRFIASFLNQLDKQVLHYTSPHIEEFNERIWINGNNVSDTVLEATHKKFLQIFPDTIIQQLTYFEYTTLMAIYMSSDFEYLVLEAGLGGEFDATNVVTNNLSVVPSIGLDHMDFLGDTIEQIASTKLRSCDNSYIFGLDMPQEVLKFKNTVLKDKKEILFKQWHLYDLDIKLPKYLQNNLLLAINTMIYLGLNVKGLDFQLIEGRYEHYLPNVIVDVGHNPLAAHMIQKELGKKKVNFIYNTYRDKNYKAVLEILKENIKTLYIIECADERILDTSTLKQVAHTLNIKVEIFNNELLDSEEYFVFGSFKVLETFKQVMGKDK